MSIISPLAGKSPPESDLVDVPRLVTAYYTIAPDPAVAAQRVAFGTSGHRGSSLLASFNDTHIAAISQAVATYRKSKGIDGPLFIGFDTHALSAPSFATALEVLGANGVELMIAKDDEYTPTPAISHSILVYNKGRTSGLADGIVITPSHNPPEDGGFKYNPPNGGPADTDITGWVEQEANRLIQSGNKDVKRIGYTQARNASTTHEHDFLGRYVEDLHNVIDFEVIRAAQLKLGVDPLGGAGVHYWARIAERYKLDLTVVSETVDPTFRFMTCDWDGRIRMDPSSKYAMQRLIHLKDKFDVAFACDTDHDRHGIVARSVGLMPANHYLAVAIDYLFRNRSHWRKDAAVGKTVVSSAMIDRVAAKLGRRLYETPVGLKWFVDGLLDGALGFGGEESAGATFSRIDGSVWTTDKDGPAAALLSAEIMARSGRDPGEYYQGLTQSLGTPLSNRVDAKANVEQKKKLAQLTPDKIDIQTLAGEKVEQVLDRAPGNQARIGGIKVIAASGWFAARPSGTEDIYKIYAESFQDEAHLKSILSEAQAVVDKTIGAA
jgi:phosphoglucomutase